MERGPSAQTLARASAGLPAARHVQLPLLGRRAGSRDRLLVSLFRVGGRSQQLGEAWAVGPGAIEKVDHRQRPENGVLAGGHDRPAVQGVNGYLGRHPPEQFPKAADMVAVAMGED